MTVRRDPLRLRPSPVARAQGRELRLLYRISDASNPKERFPFATKEVCLRNFLDVFAPSTDELLIVADHVERATWDMVRSLHGNAVRIDLRSGAASWRYAAFGVALRRFARDAIVYLVEDDYLHLPGSRELLHEGLERADYVSLYDHPDKYRDARLGGPNPFVTHGGEVTRVVRTPRSHWKLTNSTTMTFATTVGTLWEDRAVWQRHTRGRHARDFVAFLELARRGRSLITPVPGYATHCEPAWAAPGVDWERVAASAERFRSERV